MSALSNIEALIQDLNEHRPEAERKGIQTSVADAKSLATDIATLTMSDVPDEDLDYVSSLLFHPDQGILGFLHANVQARDSTIVSAETILLEFLVSFIQRARKSLQPHVNNIKSCCLIVSNASSTRIRSAAIDVLASLLNTDQSSLDVSSLNAGGIFQKYCREFALPVTKTPPTVKGRILGLLGTIVKYQPGEVDDAKFKTVQRWCLTTLDDQLNVQEKANNNLLSGVINGLDALASTSRFSIKSGSAESDKLYKAVKTMLDMPEDLARYSVPIAALEFFANHAMLFGDRIVEDSEALYTLINALCGHRNRDLSKLGYRAMESLLQQVASTLAKRSAGTKERQAFLFYLKLFMQYLRSDLDKVDFRNLSVAIRGVGYFAKAYHKYLKDEDIVALRDNLVQLSSWFYSEANADQERLMAHLPSFIQAYNQFAKNLDTIPTPFLRTILTLVDVFVANYSRLSTYAKSPGTVAVRNLLLTLYQKGEGVLRNFLSGLFYNALVYTCSDVAPPGGDDHRAFMDYVYFWDTLLQESKSTASELGRDTMSDEKSKKLFEAAIFDEFLSAVLHLVKTFNLDVTRTEDQEDADDKTATNTDFLGTVSDTLRPVNDKDFVLFQNLVDFWRILLPRLDTNRFREWIRPASSAIINLSLQKPLVSGFYTMLSAILSIADKIGVFAGLRKIYQSQIFARESNDLTAASVISEAQTDTYAAFLLFRDYLQEVWYRLQQFKDELLAACLRLVLASPLTFFDVQELVPPLRTALNLGLTYYPLATIALDALDRLVDPDSETSKDLSYLAELLPSMNDYLLMELKSTKQFEPTARRKVALSRTVRKQQQIHRKPTAELLGISGDEYTSLRDLQLRIMRFLGRIGGANKVMLNKAASSSYMNTTKEMLAWDPDRKLKIRIPFENAKIEITFDELLPRICELAESSPDRQMKVAACELLHALILVMIGNSAFQARNDREPTLSRYHSIYIRLFPVLLRLAIDIDQVARDMFRTLVAQLIHWLTNNAQYENPETIALLQTCLDATCDSNAALRYYGADCIQEFVKWSIKQTSIQAKENPMNIKSLLKRVYNMASNPSSMQRLGAAIIFNRIYRIFREEASLVDEFTFELLYWMLFGLRLAEDDHPSIGTRDQIKESISHIKRILRVKASIFQKDRPGRRKFPGIEHADMSSLVEWSFRQTGQLQRDYAKACMNFFTEFVLSLQGVSSAKEWLNDALSSNERLLSDIYEGNKLHVQSTALNDSIQSKTAWVKQLNCALDGYVWLLEREMVDAMQILEQESSSLMEAILLLVDTDMQNQASKEIQMNTLDIIRLQGLVAYAKYRLVCLLHAVASSPRSQDAFGFLEKAGLLLNPKLTDLVARMLLEPEYFVEAVQVEQGTLSLWLSSKNIRNITKRFIDIMDDSGPSRFIRNLAKSAHAIIFRSNVDLSELDMDRSALNDIAQMFEGIETLQSLGLLDVVCKYEPKFGNKKAGQQYCQELFNKFNTLNTTDEPAWINILGNMACIAFNYPEFAKEHGQELLIKPFATEIERSTIYQRFNCHINDIIASHFKEFAPLLVSNVGDSLIQNIILGLVAHLKSERKDHRSKIATLTDDLINGTTFLKDLINAWKTPSKLPDLATFMKDLFAIEPGIVKRSKNEPVFDTLCDALKLFLAQDIPLPLKTDAFELLPMYICVDDSCLDSFGDLIKEAVNRQISAYLMDSDTNTSTYSQCLSALEKLLDVMSKFHSTRMFQLLLPIFIQNDKQGDAAASIKRHIGIFAKGLELRVFEETTQACFKYYQDNQLDMKMRRNAIKLVISLLSQVPDDYVIEFYKTNIVYIMKTAKTELLRRGTDDEVICDMEEKTCAFLLMQTLYERLPASKVHGSASQIATVWEKSEKASGEGRKMTIDLVGMAHNAKNKKKPHESENVAKARLQYHQAAYNAAAAAILRTQKNEKFFVGFLIHQKPSEPLWENIVDTSQPIQLRVELNQPLMKTRLEDFRAASGLRAPAQDARNVSYMASIRLSGSSLSQSSLSDMALEATGQSPSVANSPIQTTEAEELKPEQEEQALAEDVISSPNEMEVDQFNSNPCMDFLVKIVRRMHKTITPPTGDTSKMPLWMGELNKTFKAQDTPLIVKLFLAKLIINCPEAFESYASHWIRPMMTLVIQGDQYGEPMNYFVQDLCVLLIVWGRNVSPNNSYEDRVLLHSFINYLMKNAYHETARIVKNNIQTVKDIFNNWRQQIVVPTKTLFEQFSEKADNSKRNRTGLQLTGIVLAHDLDPFYTGPEVDLGDLTEQGFFSSICDNLRNKHRDVYADAAEVAGWYISHLKNRGKAVEWFEKVLTNKLRAMDPLTQQSGDDTRFLICLHRVHLHEQSIPQNFITKVSFLMPKIYGDIKIVALRLLATYADSIDGLFTSLMSFGLPKMLKSRNDDWQLTLLKLLDKLCAKQRPSDMEQILDPLVSTFSTHSNKECRVLYYSILRTIFDNLMDTSELKNRIKALLLKGLVDPAEDIRKAMTAYLQTHFELSSNVYERLKGIMHNMYDPDVENIYILYSTQMILEATKTSYEYDKPIFDEPLPNAKFDENYQAIDTSWQRNFSMTPLFVATQERSQMDPEELESRVRATQQTLAFSQTQTGAGGSFASIFAPSQTLGSTFSSSAASESQAAVDQYRQAVGRRGGGGASLSSAPESIYTGLRRRFIKTTEMDAAAFFRRQQDRLQRRLKRYEMLQKQAREKKVILYRKYRVGELPDIQIKYMDLLVPLQAIGCNDNAFARLLHTKMVVGIANDAQRSGRLADYNKELVQDIEDSLTRSTRHFPPAIGSLIRICFELSGDPSISSDIISSVSQKSYNEHIGIAFLEKKLQYNLANAPQEPASKKARTTKTHKLVGDKALWSDLANLYRSIDEPEIFQSLYQLHVASFDEPKDAINAELKGAYSEAIVRFTDAAVEHSAEADPIEAALWSQELIHCYEQLTEWQNISNEMLEAFEGDLDRAWEEENKTRYVGYIVRSFSKLRFGTLDEGDELVPWTTERPNPLFKFLSSAAANPDRMEYLLEHHACDVSLADIYQEDYDRARFNIRHSYDSFLSTWTGLHPLAHGSRLSRLGILERTVELEDFLDLVGDIQKNEYTKGKIEKYIHSLSSRYPESKLDSMGVWGDIVYSRNVFLDDIKKLLQDSQVLTVIDNDILSCRKMIGMTMAEAAREQNNVGVSRKCIRELSQLGLTPREKSSLLLQTELQSILALEDEKKRIQRVSRQLLKIDWNESDVRLYDTEYLLMAAKFHDVARSDLFKNPVYFDEIQGISAVKKLCNMRNIGNANDLINYLTRSGYNLLQDAVKKSEKEVASKATCVWKLAEYCDGVLRGIEEAKELEEDSKLNDDKHAKSAEINVNTDQYARVVIGNCFKAMNLENNQAIEKFPRLLELIERYPETANEFRHNAETFEPVWMYIRWIPQMVATLDHPVSLNVFPSLHKLAKAYPAALYYPFNISNEHYVALGDNIEQANRVEIDKLHSELESPLLSKFCTELRRLTNPEHIVKDFIDFCQSICSQSDVSREYIRAMYEQFKELLLNRQSENMGTIPKAFATKHATRLHEFVGQDGSKLTKLSKRDITTMVDYYKKQMADPKHNASGLLKSYSTWLARFQSTDFEEQLEIPGQYTGLSRPRPEFHAKITSFDERVLVMSSIRKPKRIQINGSDERKHFFLVKGGEDLRLDQRIEQLFGVMNQLLKKDSYCARQNILINTYNIVPMSSNIGLIEWVSDTKPLRSCIDERPEDKVSMNKATEAYRTYIARFKGSMMGYSNMFKASRDQVAPQFEQICKQVRPNILRKYLFKLSISPEAFLYIRKEFVHSLAAICISGYLLGIGDRHLDNFLVDMKSGQLIPIDFGHAFGSATEMLPVPELIPFRLTRQLLGVLEPLESKDILLVAMANILRAIQLNKDVLLNTMDIFVKEPLLDWRKQALKQAANQKQGAGSTESSFTSSIAWYPQQKIENARQKLAGENPRRTVLRELNKNTSIDATSRAKLGEAVKGVAPDNIRAVVPAHCVDAKQQVECLIDQATDPNLLGRLWVGWQPFI